MGGDGMSDSSAQPEMGPVRQRLTGKRVVLPVLAIVLLAAMVWDTKIVQIGSEQDARTAGFSPEAFGAAEFPGIRDAVTERAVDAQTLADAIAADKAAAIEQYGTPTSIGGIFAVSFTGIAGEGRSGIFPVTVDGMGDEPLIRVQTGPAINGTDLRDVTGNITFGQFTNQIEYQNAGAALNNTVKTEVLAGLDQDSLTGKTVQVVGVFNLVNPKSWLITPVRFDVQ